MKVPYFKAFTFLLVMACMIGVGAAADGDVTITTPATANFSIDEPNSQTFTAAIEMAIPGNNDTIIYWYQDSVLKQTTTKTNGTSDTWTFEGGAATSGLYNITAKSNRTAVQAQWNMTVNNKIFAGITDVMTATVAILPDIVDLVVGIVPVLVTLAVVGLITGIFAAIVIAIRGGMR